MTRGPIKYKPLEPNQISQGLSEVGISAAHFADLTGSNPRRVERWCTGEEAGPPHWVPVMLALLLLPGALEAAEGIGDALSPDDG